MKETLTDIEARFAELGDSPRDRGTVELIVCRPATGERHVLQRADLDLTVGLVGDNWRTRGSKHTEDGSAEPDKQITMTNSRVLQAIEPDAERHPLAGDQLFIDMDLSIDNLPAGQRLAIGTAILEVSPTPHNGCDKFTARFGGDATRFVNSREGRQMRRRGVNMRLIRPGTVYVGDVVSKIETDEQA